LIVVYVILIEIEDSKLRKLESDALDKLKWDAIGVWTGRGNF
jgi:hypothetical protein